MPASASASAARAPAYVTPSLLEDATANPGALFDVIVQGTEGHDSDAVAADVADAREGDPTRGGLKRKFVSIAGVAATLRGSQLLKLAEKQWIESITRDSAIELAGYSSTQLWPAAAGVTDAWSWTFPSAAYPTIAVVDSGIAALPTFESRLVKSVDLVSAGAPDTYGHGTFVASIAAGADPGSAGAEPRAKLVSLRVLDGNGVGSKSDVIAACDWILQNRFAYNIRVANLSLNTRGRDLPLRRARSRGRAPLAERRGRRRGGRQPCRRRRAERRRIRPGERPVRDHRRCLRRRGDRVAQQRLRGAVVGLGLHAGRLLQARAGRARDDA